MIKKHYPALFDAGSTWRGRAEALAEKSYELVSFLSDVMKVERTEASYLGTVTYHDACSGLRELGIHEQPRRLLATLEGLTLSELPDADVCCGFGGTFCVKYPEISNKMVETKAGRIEATGADLLLAGDLGCLLNMAGKLKRLNSTVAVRHVAEVLAGMTDEPAIGDGREDRSP
jgi:L-lactate dehydrogenase complex protein LldE